MAPSAARPATLPLPARLGIFVDMDSILPLQLWI
jgi:hypothetical protein